MSVFILQRNIINCKYRYPIPDNFLDRIPNCISDFGFGTTPEVAWTKRVKTVGYTHYPILYIGYSPPACVCSRHYRYSPIRFQPTVYRNFIKAIENKKPKTPPTATSCGKCPTLSLSSGYPLSLSSFTIRLIAAPLCPIWIRIFIAS